MTDMQTMVRTEIAVNGGAYSLAQGQDLDDLKRRIEEAMRTAGTFVDFIEVGNRVVSVLISPRSQVAFSLETVQYDSRDVGEDGDPFGGIFDF